MQDIEYVLQNLTSSRSKHRRDSGTVKDSLSEMEGFLQEVEEYVGSLVEDWLVAADDGESTPFDWGKTSGLTFPSS